MITMLTGSSRTIEGQHLITVPVNFKVFNNDNAAANTVQGTVCLKVDGTSYENTSRSAYNPVGILEVTRNTRIPRAIQFCPWSLNLASQQGWWHHAVPYSQGETPVCRGDHIAVVPA